MTLTISAHAIIRWLERVEGLDLEPYRAAILECAGAVTDGTLIDLIKADIGATRINAARAALSTPEIAAAVAAGAVSLAIGAVTIIIKNGNVVTVKPRALNAPTKPFNRENNYLKGRPRGRNRCDARRARIHEREAAE